MRTLGRAWRGLIAFGFRLLYNEFAFMYDWVSRFVSFGAWRCWGLSALAHIDAARGEPVLEIAHGTGHVHVALHRAGYRAYGVDLSASMGRITRRRLDDAGLPIRLARAMAQALPFASGNFAAVITTFPTHFIIDPHTLHEIARVLRPGGRLIIVPGAVFNTSDAYTRALQFLYRVTGQNTEAERTPPTNDVLIPDQGAYFAKFGFDLTTTSHHCLRSTAFILVAQKRGADEIATGNTA